MKAHFNPIPTENFDLLHFWFFGTDLENDTPLTTIEPSKETGHANLEFNSCLEGYPFDSNHPNWRLASMERRNDPTELNYLAEGNNEIDFADAEMRGIQIREPLQMGDRRNEIILTFSTLGYEHLSLRFAARDEGAADGFEVAYRNLSKHSTFLIFDNQEIYDDSEAYHVYAFHFHKIEDLNDADSIQIRIRFLSNNPLGNTGDRINFNNISISGVAIQEPTAEPAFDFALYPNPGAQNVQLVNKEYLQYLEIFDLSGKKVKHIATSGNTLIQVSDLSQGVYLFHAVFKSGERRTLRFVKR